MTTLSTLRLVSDNGSLLRTLGVASLTAAAVAVVIYLGADCLSDGSFRFFGKRKKKLPPLYRRNSWSNLIDVIKGNGATFMLDAHNECGPVCRTAYPFARDAYLVADPKYYKQLYGADGLPKAREYQHLTNVLLGSQTLLTSIHTDLVWRLSRKGTASSFSVRALNSRMDYIHAKIRLLRDKLLEKQGTEVNLDEWYIRAAIDFVGRAMLNYELHCLDGGEEGMAIYQGIPIVMGETVKSIFFPFRKLLQALFPEAKKAWGVVDKFGVICRRIIDTNRKLGIDKDPNDHTLISELLRVDYPEDNRISDVMAFLFAGHDTTGHTLAWTTSEILKNPRVKARLQAELDTVLGDRDVPDYDDLAKLPYLDSCVKEAMRLWPVISSGSFRETDKEIEVGDYTIPAGRPLYIPFYSAFRDKRWGDPEVFRPERWCDEGPGAVDDWCKECFIPFSYGPRTCAAQTLGKITTRMTIASIFKSLDFDPEHLPTEGHWSVTLTPRGGVRVRPKMRCDTPRSAELARSKELYLSAENLMKLAVIDADNEEASWKRRISSATTATQFQRAFSTTTIQEVDDDHMTISDTSC